MGPDILSVILDVVVLLFLAGTIYYAVRLSASLKIFRDSRAEFESLIGALSRNIGEAQRAIEILKSATHSAGRELQQILDESMHLADELRLINEAGNNLATRLEGLAEKSRKMVQPQEFGAEFKDHGLQLKAEPPPAMPKSFAPVEERMNFSIKDRDFSDGDDLREPAGREDMAYVSSGFKSQAERELYEALQKNKKSGGGSF